MIFEKGSYQKNVSVGLAHLEGHIEDMEIRLPIRVSRILEGASNAAALLEGMISHHLARALRAWFRDRDEQIFKEEVFLSGWLARLRCKKNPSVGLFSPGAIFSDLFQILLCDEEGLIKWATSFDGLDVGRVNKFGTYEFYVFQAKLALRNDWFALEHRCEQWLADIPGKMKKFSPDQRFYLALARADLTAMGNVISGMLQPKEIKWRTEHEGYTGWFVVREAVIYAKIARMKGFQLEIDSPWVPAEWLALSPLDCYANPYALLDDAG